MFDLTKQVRLTVSNYRGVIGYVSGSDEAGYRAWREVIPSPRHRRLRAEELGHTKEVGAAVALVFDAPAPWNWPA